MRGLASGLKWLLWLLVLLSLLLWLLLRVSMLSQWLVNTSVAQVSGLSVLAVRGNWVQGMAFSGIHYQSDDMTLNIDEAYLAVNWLDLLVGRLTIYDFSMQQLALTLPATSDTSQEKTALTMPQLWLPIPFLIRHACLQQLTITQANQSVIDANSITVRARTEGKTLVLDALTVVVSEPDVLVQVSGELVLDSSQSFSLDGQLNLSEWDSHADMMLVGQAQNWVAQLTGSAWLEKMGAIVGELLIVGNFSHASVQAGSAHLLGGRVGLSGTVVDWSEGVHAMGVACVNNMNPQTLGTPEMRLNLPLDWRVVQDRDGINWQLDSELLQLDLIDSNKQITARIHAQGDTQAAQKLNIDATMDNLQARWQGAVSWQDMLTVAGSFTANAEQNKLFVSGQFLPTPILKLSLDAPDLSVIAGASGRAEAKGELQGSWQTLKSNLQLTGEKLSWKGQRLRYMRLTLLASNGDGHAVLLLSDLPEMGEHSQLSLTVDGRLAQHHIVLIGQAQQAKLSFNLDGGWLGELGWRGKLDKLLLSHALSGQWQQQQAVSLSASSVLIKLQQALCLKRDQAQACINADWLASGTTHASIQADHLPLAWLRPWLPDTINLPGNAQFTASLLHKAGQNSGQFSLVLPDNVLLLTEQTGISRYAYQEVVIQGKLQGKQLDTNLTAAVSPSIKTSAQISVTLTKKPSIKAKGQITLASLAPFSHSDEVVKDLVGSVDMKWQAAGKLDALALMMQVNVDQMALTLPTTGVRLQFPSLTMHMQPDGQVAIQGKLLAGEGQADLVGTAKLSNLPQWQLDVSLVGQQLQLVNMPQAQVWLNPELRLQATPAFSRLTGILLVPKAVFHPQVRSSSAIGLSDDVVFVGEQPAKVSHYAFHPDLTLRLGDDVRIEGAGLSAKLTGELQAQNNSNGQLWVEGELSVQNGKYRAYHQDLTIERGQVLFNGPIDKPGIQLRASRQAGDYQAGVEVTGTLEKANLQVFSSPTLSDSDALGVLITGRRLQDISGAEAAMLLSALADEGDADPLLNKIGKEVGLDIGLTSLGSEQTMGVSLGKRLAPDLYLRYLVGAFDYGARLITEYRINRFFSVEIQTGQYSGGDLFYHLETD